MAHLICKQSASLHKGVIVLLCFLLGCSIVDKLLPDDVAPYVGFSARRTHSRSISNLSLIYGTDIMFPTSIPYGRLTLKLLILIVSRPDNRDVRNVIRKTWLQDIKQHKLPVHYVFLVGRAPTWTLRRLQGEQQRHQDLVVFNFRDTYRNLTRKTLLGLDWASQQCPQAQYVMKADDDTYVNVTNVLNLLALEVVSLPYVLGTVLTLKAPIRVKGHKYYMSEAEYAPSLYPDYCDGGSYILPMKAARDVVQVTKQGLMKPVLHIEDVHMGRCINYLGYGLRHRNALNVDRRLALRQPGLACSSMVASMHRVSKEDMAHMWNNCTTNSKFSYTV